MIGSADIQRGDPRDHGRYLVFIRCASMQIRDWMEPTIMNWNGSKWDGIGEVVGWIGPIEPMRVDMIHSAAAPAYDL